MANYRLATRKLKDGTEKKYVVADIAALTEAEKVVIGLYAAQGLEIRAKGKGITKEEMLKEAKKLDKTFYDELKTKIDNKENFMQVKKFYNAKVKELKPDTKKAKK